MTDLALFSFKRTPERPIFKLLWCSLKIGNLPTHG